ncbi:VOC family protein [Psychroserpens algicola]|uniref:VOC family protein n=1 Tax=Psychroserpens algicola TaxID=1719034 RepID=A0ABT0HBG5_9FLAO|nr:VOC family protein [Psychroserpens algicola]MCK8481698.1 VOC family protein [Psychroserpens algicola]
MKKSILYTVLILSFSITACKNQNTSKTDTTSVESNINQITKEMKSHISIFEIPATDISRAVNFYQAILDITIEKIEMPEMEMGIFPYEEQMVTGVIIKAEGNKPSSNGVTIYLNGGDNLQIILDKIEKNGGKIMVPKSLHADESGYYALFLDSEGNKIGLHSPN